MDGLDLTSILGNALNSQVSQFGIAFLLAAWVHSGRVKKEIKSQMSLAIEAVNNVGDMLKKDLQAQGSRIERIERVVNFEKIKGEDHV